MRRGMFCHSPRALLAIALSVVVAKSVTDRMQIVEVKCTPNCVCDHFRNLRRASCNHQKMAAVKDNVPRRAEILEFAHNYVTKIRNDEFHDNDLSGLIILNISHNRIAEIEIFAFEPVSVVQILDLSFNALQYILPEWFWGFSTLKEVHLQHNNLGATKDMPLFSSPTLQMLDLSYCQLPHLYDSLFAELPNLEELDVSNNYLIDVKITVISGLEHLKEINLQSNPIKCENAQEFLQFLLSQSIEYKIGCISKMVDEQNGVEDIIANTGNKRSGRFEKIINWPQDTRHESESVETSWIFEETLTEHGNAVKECPRAPDHRKHYLMELIELSPVITLSTCLGVGFLMGLLLGCACRRKKPLKKRSTLKSMHRVSRSFSLRGGPMQDREFLIDQ